MTKHHHVAIDYYNTRLTMKEIAKKHGYSSASGITNIINRMDPKVAQIPSKEDKVVIVIDKKDAPKAEYVLRGNGISHHTPEKFELTEFYESEI